MEDTNTNISQEKTPGENKIDLKKETLEELKLKLKKKLSSVKSELKTLNSKLSNNIATQSSKIKKEYLNYITDIKNKSITYVEIKSKKIKDKEFISSVYFEVMRKIKRYEKFEKNLSDIILDSLSNYNNFINYKLPFYKNATHQFLMNNEDKLCNNNIYSKLTRKQLDKVYQHLKSKNLINYINCKNPVDIKMNAFDNCLENCIVLSSNKLNQINSLEIDKLNDESFSNIFKNVRRDNDIRVNELILKNCELKGVEIAEIPFGFRILKIFDSKIFSSIFNNMSFENLIKINLDNTQMDSNNFERIFKSLLKIENKNLKEISAKKNYISRICLDNEYENKSNVLVSLEILNLSSNSIYKFDKRILDLLPNLKILDLSNNTLLHQNNCKELIKNCKGIVLLLKNIVISKDSMYNYYTKYYKNCLAQNNNNKLSIDYINFDSLFYKRNRNNIDILNFDFSQTKNIENMSNLNISSCSLDDNQVINIFPRCLSIKNNISELNISYNLLTEKIFDLLIEDKINVLLKNLKKLDLSNNSIHFKLQNKSGSPMTNQFVMFLTNYSQLEFLYLKTTPFEESINEYIKNEVNMFMAEEKKKEKKKTEVDIKVKEDQLNVYNEIKEIVVNKCLQINDKFHFYINDLITLKYIKRVKQAIPLLNQNVIIENCKPEEKSNKQKQK
jgi:hypothetical protein